jgi:hypothetical protein
VADAKLILKPPHMLVRMKPGYWPDLPKMQQTIRDAGYQPIEGGVELRVTGKVVSREGRVTLELDGMKAPAVLMVVPSKESPEAAAHLERHFTQTVDVEGYWQPASDKDAGSLAVRAIHKAGGPAK